MINAIVSVVTELVSYIVIQVVVEGIAAVLMRLGIKPWVVIAIGLAMIAVIAWLVLRTG